MCYNHIKKICEIKNPQDDELFVQGGVWLTIHLFPNEYRFLLSSYKIMP